MDDLWGVWGFNGCLWNTCILWHRSYRRSFWQIIFRSSGSFINYFIIFDSRLNSYILGFILQNFAILYQIMILIYWHLGVFNILFYWICIFLILMNRYLSILFIHTHYCTGTDHLIYLLFKKGMKVDIEMS